MAQGVRIGTVQGVRAPLSRAIGSLAVASALAPVLGQYVPSVVALGQWTPLEALPRDICRWRGPPDRAEVALTFDDGPDPCGTPAILDRLDDLGLVATFFPLASVAARHRDLVTEIARRGHAVGTHGHTHGHHLAHGPGWVRRDLDTAASVMETSSVPVRWFRPPYGQVTAATLVLARRQGWMPVLWSAWGREWATRDARMVAERVRRRLEPGAIVLLHDSDRYGRQGMWRTVRDALGRISEDLDERGLRTVSLDTLVR